MADNGKFEARLRLDVGVPPWDQYAALQGALSFSMTALVQTNSHKPPGNWCKQIIVRVLRRLRAEVSATEDTGMDSSDEEAGRGRYDFCADEHVTQQK